MLGVLQKQEVKGEETLWLVGREAPPAREGWAAQDCKVPAPDTRRPLLWRRSQAVQLPLIQAFPVLKVVVQVLHKIGKVCKSWRDDK